MSTEYYRIRLQDQEKRKHKYETNRLWRTKHLERYRELVRKSQRQKRMQIKKEIIQFLGSQCANPYNLNHGDFMFDIRCLQIDHIYGGGKIKKRGIKTNRDLGSSYYRKILKEIKAGSKDYQLLCANCNWIKRYENNEKGNGGRPPMNPDDWKNGKNWGRKVVDVAVNRD
jgi:hypothetical protein